MGASTAARGPRSKHPVLKLMENTGRKEGHDAAGRPIPEVPAFSRKLPEKPAVLSPDAEWMWDKVIEQMGTVGVLKPLDGPALEVICETFARWRQAVRIRQMPAETAPGFEDEADPSKRKVTPGGLLNVNSQGVVAGAWIGIEERAGRDFRAWCAEFGLTPAAEKNLAEAPELTSGSDNPF